MSFNEILQKYETFNFEDYFKNITTEKIEKSLQKEKLEEFDFLNLISPLADKYLENIARKSQKLTIQNFGKNIQLYIPLYLSNYCSNECLYCGFSTGKVLPRKKLSYEEIEKEVFEISKTGIKHILLLTGESKENTSMEYLSTAIEISKKYFDAIAIEMHPMETEEYKILKEKGAEGITIYQETYDKVLYDKVHLKGKKKDFLYRLDTPERAAKAGMTSISISALYGLGDSKKDAFFTALHAKYLYAKYPTVDISVSVPRIRNEGIHFNAENIVSDKEFVKIMMAYRLLFPNIGINISTRESADFRDNLIGLGATKFSAGSKTEVGGYGNEEKGKGQFEISDDRSVAEVEKAIKAKGYDAIYKDWEIMI